MTHSDSMRTFATLMQPAKDKQSGLEFLVIAGGCFWGIEYFFELEAGVIETACGYTGGNVENPTYQQVCSGNTGHAEAVAVIFDSQKTNLQKLLDLFFSIHNPKEINRQGPDIGTQYRSALFPTDTDQQQLFEKNIQRLSSNGDKIATSIEPFGKFWVAEDFHQKYFSSRNEMPTCHLRR